PEPGQHRGAFGRASSKFEAWSDLAPGCGGRPPQPDRPDQRSDRHTLIGPNPTPNWEINARLPVASRSPRCFSRLPSALNQAQVNPRSNSGLTPTPVGLLFLLL